MILPINYTMFMLLLIISLSSTVRSEYTKQQLIELAKIMNDLAEKSETTTEPVQNEKVKQAGIKNVMAQSDSEECGTCDCPCPGCRIELQNVTIIHDITELSPLLSRIREDLWKEACHQSTLPIKLTKVQKYILQMGYGVFIILIFIDQFNLSKKRKCLVITWVLQAKTGTRRSCTFPCLLII